MIPHKLLTTFLSISISTNIDVVPSSDTNNLQRVDVPKAHELFETHGVNPSSDIRYDVKLEHQHPLGNIPLPIYIFPV